MNHQSAALVATGKCEDCFFVNVRPAAENDNRRWIGFLSNSKHIAAHHHPEPVPSKLGSQLKGDIIEVVQKDSTKTADDLSKGIGLGYIPISASPVAANKDIFRQFVAA